MRSMFNLALEGADSTDSLSGDSTPTPVNEAGLLEGAMEDYAEMCETESSVDKLIEGQDNLTEIVEVAQESLNDQGLSPRALSILKLAVKNIVGKNIASRSIPSMESYSITHPKQVTAIALEGVTDTIKQFWQAIKNQMGKFWNQTKQWYLKTFDVANKIIARAKKLDERASTLASAPTEKSFDLGGVGFLSVAYQVKNPAPLIVGLGALKNIIDAALDTIAKDNANDRSDAALNASKNLLARLRSRDTKEQTGQALNSNEMKGLVDALNVNVGDDSELEKLLKATQVGDNETDLRQKLGVDQTQKVSASVDLPGNRKLYNISFFPEEMNNPQTASITLLTDVVKKQRKILADAAAKPREMEDTATVMTLNSSQMSEIASTVGEMGETILKYKKEFEARDRYINKLVKGFDQIMKDLDGTPVEHPPEQQQQQNQPATNTGGSNGQAATTVQSGEQEGDVQNATKPIESVDKDIRKLASAFMHQFKKEISLSGSLITHATKVANAFLTYGERSLAQYGG